ncbi:MAG: PD40 domain-containing protein [Chloroflexi bacterium]|nr:PD40 domain-containing protein [Chloroflexota bacterium]
MVKRLTLLLVFGSVIFASPTRAQEPSNPYIFYFSDTLHAFIIERADGTDTHVLGAELMTLADDAQSFHVDGPGWSPSGQWFAWTAAQIRYNNGYFWSDYSPYVLSVDGTQQLALPDQLQDVQLVWARDTDLLLAVSRTSERLHPDDPNDTHSVIHTYLALIDVTSGTVVAALEDQTFSDYYIYQRYFLRPTVVHTNDGQHFIVSYVDYEGGDSYYGTMLLVMFDTQGTITQKRLDAYGPISMDGHYSDFPSVSPAGWVAYPTAKNFQVDNLLTGETYIFPRLDDPNTIFGDASGQYAMLTDGDLWLLDCAAGTLVRLREDWILNTEHIVDEWPVWSPDSRYAVLLNSHNGFAFYDRTANTLTEFVVESWKPNTHVKWYWPDATHCLLYREGELDTILYDLVSSTARPLTTNLSPPGDYDYWVYMDYYPRLSPDGRLLVVIGEGAIIYDRAAGSLLGIRPDYGAAGTTLGGEVAWHDSGDWLLIFEDALVAGGAYVRDLGIVRADGTLRRDLSFSWMPNPITLNWLPPQIDPADLPPAEDVPLFPQPEGTLYGSHWSFYVDWSPDSRWLAAGQGDTVGGDITVWEVDTGEIVHVFEDAKEDERVVWPQGETFVPQLMIPDQIDDTILARSPDGRQLVQNDSLKMKTRVIDAATGEVLSELSSEWPMYFTSASYSSDGHLLATVNPYAPLRIWDTSTWELAVVLPNPGEAAAFSPDGRQLAVTASWDVQIWDVAKLLEFGVQ